MTKNPFKTALVSGLGVTCALAAGLALLPSAGQATAGKPRTQTLRFFDQPVALKLTHADGMVVDHQPFPDVAPGDVLEVDSLDFRGDHKHHARQWTGSAHLRCTFSAAPEPDCQSTVAFGGSLLFFTGNPGVLTGGTGIYQGATGKVLSNTEVKDNASDIVAKITLARNAPTAAAARSQSR